MAEQENTNVPDSGENTQTRKTVKLKVPTAPVTSKMTVGQPTPASPIADPLSGRDTDTGNLDILSDTQTRKTVKLKPLSAAAENRPISIPGASPAPAPAPVTAPAPVAAPAAPAPEGASTNTRKVLVLKPTPAKHTPVNPEVSPSKQTMVLADAEVPQPVVEPSKQTMVLADATDDENSDTVKVQKVDAPVKPGVAAVEEADDKTVKVQRPVRPPAPAPAPAAPAPAPAPAPAVPVAATAVTPDDDKATVKLARPAMPKPAAPAPAPAAPAPAEVKAEEAQAEDTKGDAPKSKLSLKKDKEEAKAAPPQVAAGMAALGLAESGLADTAKPPRSASSPSVVYTALAAVTLILLIASAALCTIQYLNFHQDMKIDLPVPGISK